MIGIDKVNMQELKAAVKELNGLELLAEAIKVIGVTKQVLVDAFVEGVESISLTAAFSSCMLTLSIPIIVLSSICSP